MKERSGGAPPDMVNILPGIQTLALFRHYDYTPWQAMADFVDNSISSWQRMQKELESVEGKGFRLTISIELDSNERLRIVDNAGGIGTAEYGRAFTVAAPPADLTHMNQFGVGMKVAACWFSNQWQVRTSALNEPVTSTVIFNVPEIVEKLLENLPIDQVKELPAEHFTEILLWDLIRVPKGKTKVKICDHLTKMYRRFIENNSVTIYCFGEKLSVMRSIVLTAPHYRNPGGQPREWKLPLDFYLSGLRITGEAYLLDKMNRKNTGLNLFWRNRLIRGNIEPYYRPTDLFGAVNSWRTGRLCIELDMSAFRPTADRASIDFDAKGCSEEELWDEVKQQLSKPGCPILAQGEGYRAKSAMEPSIEEHVKKEIAQVGDEIKERGEKPLEELAATTSAPAYPDFVPSATNNGWEKTIEVTVAGEKWEVTIETGDGPGDFEWVKISETAKASKKIGIKLGMRHPFNVQYMADTTAPVIIRLAAALAFAELAARKAGAIQTSLVRANMNEFLRSVLSVPLEK